MSYEKTDWKDRIVQYPDRYQITENEDGTVTITPKPGEVEQEGTPVDSSNLSNIEDGVESAYSEIETHKSDNMPHKTADGNYRYGWKIDEEELKFIYEEVE